MPEVGIKAIFEVIQGIKSQDDLYGVMKMICDHFDVAHAIYFWTNSDGAVHHVGTYPEAWLTRYLELGYGRQDPVVHACYHSFRPIDWQDLDWSTKAAQAIMTEAVEAGVGPQGLTIPVRGPKAQYAVFTISDDTCPKAWRTKCAEHMADLLVLTHLLNDCVLELGAVERHSLTRPLSPREVDAMTYLARGYSRAKVAATLEISEHTLRAYIESAREKLGATNTVNAVAKAISHGFIII
ncbi:LuxR family transcriptional regulator [Donghicola sp. C2-DW-16]|uniref:LuxR family transcriptional regulator n=1 Tax=Donghicola mangrovi TaxID=2729614 RepID=A0ABX2PAU9_9RHOB|nr:LuxR family transcriptional regulator [Donghicola mangrovi]NVO26605.1 LuxR family transcriptional regulator [Donghicola mangrovi]